MSEQLTKEKAQNAASALGALILSSDVGALEKETLNKALAVAWTLYDRVDEESE